MEAEARPTPEDWVRAQQALLRQDGGEQRDLLDALMMVALALAAAESRGRAEEREACAQIFDEPSGVAEIDKINRAVAAAIRARGRPRAAPSEIPQENLRAPALTPSDPEKGRARLDEALEQGQKDAEAMDRANDGQKLPGRFR